MFESPSGEELAREAREAREAIAKYPETPDEHFARLIKEGFINSQGKVTWLLGGEVDPEPPPAGPDEPFVRDE